MIGSTRSFSIFTLLVSLFLTLGSSSRAQAGGGPENVLLVVNPKSVDSMTVANHYLKFRDIPSRNVLYLDWNPESGTTDVESFRTKILTPILKAIEDRGLIGQVDYVIYSTDYPWRIDLKSDVNRFLDKAKENQKEGLKPPKWPKILKPYGSLTSMTYLYQLVLTKQPVYTGLASNRYMRIMKGSEQTVPTIGFSNRLRFDAEGKPTKEMTGCKYLLSVALGITGKHGRRGNSVEEIIQYLERSVTADATFPQGIIYYDDNSNVRSQTRKPGFAAAVEALAKLGVKGEIVEKYPPKGAMNIMGLTLGSSSVRLKPWLKGIRPGAICDNLTSFGGVMKEKASQTPITDFLRAGMAGASGTVVEPYALRAKFPSPMIHVHYARGCSLAEAFYQSIHGPYQMLILGEPLCKPWARVPRVSIKMTQQAQNTQKTEAGKQEAMPVPKTIEPNQTISGKLTLYPSSVQPGGRKTHHFEIYLDGHLVGICLFRGDVLINSARLGDGYHELRVVAVSPQPVYTRGYKIVPIKTANHGRSIEVKHNPTNEVRLGEPILIEATCPGATRIDVKQNGRSVAEIDGEAGRVKVDTNALGKGPVTLQVIGILGKGAKNRVFAEPISIEVR